MPIKQKTLDKSTMRNAPCGTRHAEHAMRNALLYAACATRYYMAKRGRKRHRGIAARAGDPQAGRA